METSQTIGKISEALAKAQGAMKPALFDASNPHFRSKYASLASIMEACRSALSANGIAVVQGTSVQENSVIVTTMLICNGEWIRDSLSIKLAREDAQAIGSAITYARRYSLASMVGIVADEDDDAENAVGRTNTAPATKPNLTTVKKAAPENNPNKASPEPKAPSSPTEPQQAKVEAPKPATAPVPVNPRPVNGNGRVAKIRILFNLSSQLGQTPDQMKAEIGRMLGMDRPIKESSEIPNDKLDVLISEFQAQLAGQNQPRKEAA